MKPLKSSSDYVERAGRLVIDANVAIGAILSGHQGRTRHLLQQLATEGVVLFAPEELLQEVERHLTYVVTRSLARRHITGNAFIQGQQDAANIWDEVQTALWLVPLREYGFFETAARKRVPADPDDWPYVALALRLDCAILTKNLAHFAGSGIPIWSLETVGLLLEE